MPPEDTANWDAPEASPGLTRRAFGWSSALLRQPSEERARFETNWTAIIRPVVIALSTIFLGL